MTNLTNYHSHCLYCDGRANMDDFIRFAISEGFTSYGISSHAPLPFSTAWTMEWEARRVHARYMLGMKVKDIAAMEGITPSQAGKSIHAALRRLRRYFIRRKWTSGL